MRRRAAAETLPVLHRHAVRVYWEDTDAGGIVYHANHLRWFERARTEWLRVAGFGQAGLREREGVVFVVMDAALRWIAPARLDDALNVTVAVAAAGSASMTFAQRLLRGDEALAEAHVRVGCLDAASMRPRRLPASIAAAVGVPAEPPRSAAAAAVAVASVRDDNAAGLRAVAPR